jgi:trimeric autotransporter adhesin
MKMSRILIMAGVVTVGMLVSAGIASAITTPDVNSAVCTGSTGCFRMRSSNSTQTLFDATPNGTTITATATGSSTAIKGFTDGSGTGATAIMAVCTGSATAMFASASSGTGLSAGSGSGTAVLASSTSGTGVDAFTAANSGTAVSGRITGVGTAAKGVFGQALNGTGVYGATTGTGSTAVGVYGTSSGYGVQGATTRTSGGATGIYGTVPAAANGSCAAIRGDAQGGFGTGVFGSSGNGWGVFGMSSTGGGGVKAEADGTNGIAMNAEAYGTNGIAVYALSTGSYAVYADPSGTSKIAYYGAGGIQLTGSMAEKVNGGMWTAPSDRRIKKDVKDFERGVNDLMRVHPVRFKYNGLGGTEDNGKEYVGVLAQELEQIVPSMVHTRKAKLHKDDVDDTDIKLVDPSDFTYVLINAVKQQQRTIEKQDARIAALERRSPPVVASLAGGLGGWAALALLPIGVLIGRKRRTA